MSAAQKKHNDIYSTLSSIEKKWQQLDSTIPSPTFNNKVTNKNSNGSQGIPVGELLFLSTYLREYYVGELIAIKSDKGAWVELNSLFELLNFSIAVDNKNLIAQGWFISKDNSFDLDLNDRYVQINKKVYPIDEQDFYLESGDIYIDATLLNNWFNLGGKIKFNTLELSLAPASLLPIEKKMQREKRNVYKQNNNTEATLPWKPSPYQAISSPVADLQLSYNATENSNTLSYAILGAQDLAYFNSEYYFSGRNADLLTDSRLTFTREDLNANLLGPLNATTLEFGDILPTQIGSKFLSRYARGLKINNTPLYKKTKSNQITLTGAVQAGWDVELYRNEILIDQQLSLPDGRYLFENIELLYGVNTFELIFYGPQGEVERKVEEFIIDGNSLDAGDGFYELSLTQQGKQLLGSSNIAAGQDGWLLSGRYEKGITDYFSVYTGGSFLRADENTVTNYAVGSSISVLDKVLINLDYEQNNSHEKEFKLSTRSEIAGQSVRFSMQKVTDLLSEDAQQSTFSNEDNYELFFSGNVMDNSYGRLSYQNTAVYTRSDTYDDRFRFGNILNYSIGRYSFNNNLLWVDNNTLFGSSRLQARFGKLGTRFGVSYSLEPSSEIVSYETEFYRALTSSLQAELRLSNLLETNTQFAELGLNWQTDLFNVNSSFNYDTDDNWRIGLFSRFSLGFDTKNNDYIINNRSLVQSGSLMVHVYLDANNNGVFDMGEQNLEGVKVKGLQNYRSAITDEKGVALLSGMPANLTTDIVIEPDSISDPFLITANDGFSITPRAGFVEYMEIPLNNSSEIEGTVYQQKEGEPSQIQPFATVKLLDKQGKQVAQTQAAYDGYYLFTDLRPGQYKAVIDDEFKERKALKNTQQLTVNLPAQGEVVMGVDFELKEKEKTPAFIANAGRFTSLPIMKAYYQLIKRHLNSQSKREAFYIKDDNQDRYILAVAYAESEQERLEQVCAELKIKGLTCEVQAQLISH